MERREFKRERWSWNEEWVEVSDLKTLKVQRIRWTDVVGISRLMIHLEKSSGMGRGIWLPGVESEARSLRRELNVEWKTRCPCRWVASVRRSARATRLLFRDVIPGMAVAVLVIPWLVLLAYMNHRGVEAPELEENCVRRAIADTFISMGWGVFYLVKVRGMIARDLLEAEEVARSNNCQASAVASRGTVPPGFGA